MRGADRPLPPIDLHVDERLDRFPLRPVIAISGLRKVAEWDDPDLVYDADTPNDPVTTARVGSARVGSAKVGQG